MQRISITNPQNIIDGTAKKYYFKLRNTGGPKGDKGDKGDTGSRGPQGEPGDPCTVVVNSTATLEPGSNAYVTNTGSLSNAVLNFGIPQGPRGPQGIQGERGEPGQTGQTGPRGPQGERGTNATVSIGTTYTLAPGSQATVYNSGSDSNAVLNFGIPKGEKGDTGSQGPTGPAGQNFAPTVVAELPATGDSSKLYLTPKAHTTQTATGNPITATVAEEAGKIESFQLDGDTFQQSYTGKNLLNLSASRYSVSGTDYSFDASSGVLTVTMSSAPAVNRYSGWSVAGITAGAKYTFSIESFTNSALSNTDRAMMIRSHNGTSASELATLNKTQTSYTFTVPNDSVRLEFYFYIASGNTDSTSIITKPMLEAGETATAYEPFVGGQPSPSPDYPQAIQTVTGLQTVEVQGKNLLKLNDGATTLGGVAITTTNGTVNLSGTATSYAQGYYVSIGITASEPMVFTTNKSGTTSGLDVRLRYKRGGTVYYPSVGSSLSLQAGDIIQQMYLIVTNGSTLDGSFSPMLEKGSTATAYEPYHATDYPLDLGSIELCKLGTYQDYIWKDGEDWKVHKAVAKHALKPNEGWVIPNPARYPNLFQTNAISDLGNLSEAYTTAPTSPQAYCEALVYLPGSGDVRTTQGFSLYHTVEEGAAYNLARINIAGFTTTTQLNNWLSTCNANFWYGVKIPTDTTITDQTLIAQLEAIRTASLQNGANTITDTATGSNLAGDMEIGYYGYNPTNRYDKWLWLDLNNNYEQIGS